MIRWTSVFHLSLLLVAAACQANAPEPVPTPTPTASRGSLATSTSESNKPTVRPTALPVVVATVPVEKAEDIQPSATPSPEPTRALVVASPSATPLITRAGALVALTMRSQVGVLLSEFPASDRDRIVAGLMAQSEAEWRARAIRQVRLARLRMNFRDFHSPGKGQLPLPPASLWQIELDPEGPSRQQIQGHDLVLIDYTFSSTLLTDPDSLADAEPALAHTQGEWTEPFIFPADPDMLFQRTDIACVNEGGFPPNSYDSENVWHFYDYTCTADSVGSLGCHRFRSPAFSCRQALQAAVGEIETELRLQRLAWDSSLANQVRIGAVSSNPQPDLAVVSEDLANTRIRYRFVSVQDCALEEGAVGGAGWRRLLQFDATVHNIGAVALHIGAVRAEDPEHNVFEYSPCHDHFHYSNYGDFFLQDRPEIASSKQAFCVQSTSRFSNNEASPITHDYSCTFQGIQAGWVDEYVAGLDSQWIDITDLVLDDAGETVQLGFTSNRDGFLCEGTPIIDETGQRLWEPTDFRTDSGAVIDRPLCDFAEGWDQNNVGLVDLSVPATGSFVTEACHAGEIGPKRNCGLSSLPLPLPASSCTPGETVELDLAMASPAPTQFVRVCEWSDTLGHGIACTFSESVANQLVVGSGSDLAFTCPSIRDSDQPGLRGGFALYVGAVWPGDSAATISVTTNAE